jgi:hypothetical protein
LIIDWYEKNLKWTPRSHSTNFSRRRVMEWKEIQEIRLGTNDQWWTGCCPIIHTTGSSNTTSSSLPKDPECCMTIVSSSRTLDLEFKTSDQRKMFAKGLESLLDEVK